MPRPSKSGVLAGEACLAPTFPGRLSDRFLPVALPGNTNEAGPEFPASLKLPHHAANDRKSASYAGQMLVLNLDCVGATVALFSNRATFRRGARLQTAQPWHPQVQL